MAFFLFFFVFPQPHVVQRPTDSIACAVIPEAPDTAAQLGAEGARVRVQDRGAYDCVIAARVEAALLRAAKEEAS